MSNNLLLQWTGLYEEVEIVNRIDYRVDLNGVVGTYHANMLKQYVEHRNVMSHCLMSAEANAKVLEQTETRKFGLDNREFQAAKKPHSYNDSAYLMR